MITYLKESLGLVCCGYQVCSLLSSAIILYSALIG